MTRLLRFAPQLTFFFFFFLFFLAKAVLPEFTISIFSALQELLPRFGPRFPTLSSCP